VAFRKGDPKGSRWLDDDPLFILWREAEVDFLFEMSGKGVGMPYIRNSHLYFTEGVTWTRVANHVRMKARIQPKCVFDLDSVRLTPIAGGFTPRTLLSLFNSDIFSFLKMKFFQHTAKWEIGNIRQIPLVIPTPAQSKRLDDRRPCDASKASRVRRRAAR
jgi:hypothetical protein